MLRDYDLALVWVQTEDDAHRVGTAYAVTDAMVLTARHVWRGNLGESVGRCARIRFAGETMWRDADEAWLSPDERDWDACLLRLREPRRRPRKLAWGEHDRSMDVAYESCGYPGASVMDSAETALREVADIRGTVLRHGGLVQGFCELTAEAAPPDARLWRGLSGAPVFADGHLIAMIRSAPTGFAGERLWATPVARLLEDDRFATLVDRPALRWVPVSVLVSGSSDLPNIDRIGPATLLGASYGVVPFFEPGRTRELDWLRTWVTSSQTSVINLLIGPGGAGKTRLFIDWCRRLSMLRAPDGKRWEAGFLPQDASEAQIDALLARSLPLFLVIDYAETRPRLRDVLRRFVHAHGLVRVALLARNVGDWWRALGDDGDVLHDVANLPGIVTELSPLELAGALRRRAFDEAYRAFALQQNQPGGPPVAPALEEPQFGNMLYLHVAALAALAGEAVAPDQLLDWVIKREHRVWKRWAPNLVSEQAERLFVQQARRAVAALTLVGGATGLQEGEAVIRRAHGPEPADGFADFLHQLYPGHEAAGVRASYVTGLEPDLLGEVLVASVLADASTPAQYLDQVFAGRDAAALRAGFTVLGRIALEHRSPGAEDWLVRLLDFDLPGRVEAALDVALALGEKTAFASLGQVLEASLRRAGNADIAERLQAKLPDDKVSLRELAVWVYETLVAALPQSMEDTRGRRAALLTNLGVQYSALGRAESALAATREAVECFRELAAQDPDAFLQDLAQSLSNLGNHYGSLGRHEAALEAAYEAFEIRHKLATQRPDAFLPDLAQSLNNLGEVHAELEHHQEAFAATRDAVEHYRTLAGQRPEMFLPLLALSLTNLGNRYAALGQLVASRDATGEALAHYRKLAAQQPDSFLPYLSGTLNNFGTACGELGQHEAALNAAQEAVELRRKLAARQPDAFLAYLMESLGNLETSYSALGQTEAALKAADEAVDILRKLAGRQPDNFLPELAQRLDDLGMKYSEQGKMDVALGIFLEEVETCRALVGQRPDAFLPDLARSLNNLGAMHGGLEDPEAALVAFIEAVEHYRNLAAQVQDVFLPGLAKSFDNLGAINCELGDPHAALAALLEAVEQYRKLTAQNQDAFWLDLAKSLNNLSICYSELGQSKEALAASEEAVTLYSEMGQTLPDAYVDDLGDSVEHLAHCLQALGQNPSLHRLFRVASELLRSFRPE